MKKTGLIFFVLSISLWHAFAQPAIHGKVVNENGQPIAGASVFISNTSKGTVSNSAGNFSLEFIPAGTHELVTSSIGYETFTQSFSSASLPLELIIRLKLKVKELEGVTVIPFEKDGWAKWGKLFLENFIGTTKNADDCKILNYKNIHFRFLKKENKLIAIASEPLIIINKALGYKIQYQLEDFQVDYQNNSMVYLGYPLFEDLGKTKKRWQKQRKLAYVGSVMNFVRASFANTLQKDGFEIKRLRKVPNYEKIRVKEIYQTVRRTMIDPKTGQKIITVDYEDERFNPDSVVYYKRILQQRDSYDVYGNSLLTADSFVVTEQNGRKYLSFSDYLYITCRNTSEEIKYLQSIMEGNRKSFYQRSSVILSAPVTIEANGNYYSPQDLFSLGYWGWSEKIANMLPFDYNPAE